MGQQTREISSAVLAFGKLVDLAVNGQRWRAERDDARKERDRARAELNALRERITQINREFDE